MIEKRLADILPPIAVNGFWHPGPVNGNDPLERDMIEVGDRFIVLVNCVINHGNIRNFWDAHIIVATEIGWDTPDGESWGSWSWSDVSWYCELTKEFMPQL